MNYYLSPMLLSLAEMDSTCFPTKLWQMLKQVSDASGYGEPRSTYHWVIHIFSTIHLLDDSLIDLLTSEVYDYLHDMALSLNNSQPDSIARELKCSLALARFLLS